VLLLFSRYKPAWAAGTTALSAAKILENMEIGHNVMHGQWDWMNDPQIHSSTWDWDTASTKEAWEHSHNYIHHTYTNIRGKDKDLGYEIKRIDPHQPWNPVYLLQPLYKLLLMFLFEWGVAVHDLDFDAIRSGEKSQKQVLKELKGIAGKARLQIQKDYVVAAAQRLGDGGARPRPDRPQARSRAASRPAEAALAAEEPSPPCARRRPRDRLDGWREGLPGRAMGGRHGQRGPQPVGHSIIFCGHFPDQTYTFGQEEVEDGSRGAWYVRQLVGAANIEGSAFFHVASGNLGYQVEHHLFPDMPSTRYAEIGPARQGDLRALRVALQRRAARQVGMVRRTILRLALPGGKPRPKPGPYSGGDAADYSGTGIGAPRLRDRTGRARSRPPRACGSRCHPNRTRAKPYACPVWPTGRQDRPSSSSTSSRASTTRAGAAATMRPARTTSPHCSSAGASADGRWCSSATIPSSPGRRSGPRSRATRSRT
jgi:fatty acid desaturase